LTRRPGFSLDPDDTQPKPRLDDITTCVYCRSVLVVTTVGFRLATDEDLARLDPDLRRLVFEFISQKPS
jgi:hypothetical protein